MGIQPPKILSVWNPSNDEVKGNGFWKNGKYLGGWGVLGFFTLSFRNELRETHL